MPPTYQEEHDLRRELNENLESLTDAINKSSKSSDNLQKKLIFWTKVMASAIIVQVIALIVITFFSN